MKREKVIEFIKKYAVITFGCILYSLGAALFLDANKLAAGGVTGIAIIITSLANWESGTGIMVAVINVPLLIIGAIFFGRKFLASTVYATILSSLLIEFWAWQPIFGQFLPFTQNLLIAAICGGALFGAGIGIIFRMGSSTGGTDIIVKLLRKKFRHISTGIVSMAIDVAIVGCSAFVYKNFEQTFYTVLSLATVTVFLDLVLYGGNSAKLVYIVTTDEHCGAICDKILKELDISATIIDGKGAYTGDTRAIIMCAVKKILYPKLRDIIKEEDPRAFTIVSSAREIYGEGYKEHDADEL